MNYSLIVGYTKLYSHREKAEISFEIINKKICLFLLSMLLLIGCHKLPNRKMYWETTSNTFVQVRSDSMPHNMFSAKSRAILKPVYQSGIPNSNPQMLESVDFWCKLSSTFLVAEPRERCFELFRMQNSQKFPGFCPWTPLGRAYSAAPDSPAAQRFFFLLHPSKKCHS